MTDKQRKKLEKLISEKKSGWLEKAKWREANEEWLDTTFNIATKINLKLKENKKNNIRPSNAEELQEELDWPEVLVTKLLKGEYNLSIKSIKRIEKVLDIKLIEVI